LAKIQICVRSSDEERSFARIFRVVQEKTKKLADEDGLLQCRAASVEPALQNVAENAG
jgi:hypothetical protein